MLKKNNLSFSQSNLFLYLLSWYPLFNSPHLTFHENEDSATNETLFSLHALLASIYYELLFEPLLSLPLFKEGDHRWPSFYRQALLKPFRVGSIQGAFLGAMLVSLIDTFGQALFPQVAMFAIFLAMINTILVMPSALSAMDKL